MSASSSALDRVVRLAAGDDDLEAVVRRGVVGRRDHDPGGAWRASRLACARQGVVTRPRSTASVPAEVSPAARAAESISPERLVSRPMRTLDPDPPSRCPTARPSDSARSASMSEPTGPRIPSVPKRPAIYGAGVGVGAACGAWIVTGTVAGLIPTSCTPSGRPLTTGVRSWFPGSSPEASTVGVRLAAVRAESASPRRSG